MARLSRDDEYGLVPRASTDSKCSFPDSEYDFSPNLRRQYIPRAFRVSWTGLSFSSAHLIGAKSRQCRLSRRPFRRRLCWTLAALPYIVILLLCFTAVLWPSYTHPPEHYREMDRRCKESREPGRANVNNENVFIAATLDDKNGQLLSGDWAVSVVELVHLLGPKNVHLSIYQNDPDDGAKRSLERLGEQISCNSSLVAEHLPVHKIPFTITPSGGRRTKRIAFLAEVRNRALHPLYNSPIQFDRVLYINDVMFDPIEAAQLLFSTNIDANGRAQYGAACAVDFVNPFKFYDRYATRDLEGFETGLPFYPWFTNAGNGSSRKDVLAQKDAVRVRACWGGMTAFEAGWMQGSSVRNGTSRKLPNSRSASLQVSPLRFRYELDSFWDASECCLIHADLAYLRNGHNITTDTGVYMNPYVRVAYDSYTLSWLPHTRRIERTYSLIHNLLNQLIGLPVNNPRRLEQPGDVVVEKVWKYNESEETRNPSNLGSSPNGSFHDIERVASPGRFCGRRALAVLRTNPKEGEKSWISIPLPLPLDKGMI